MPKLGQHFLTSPEIAGQIVAAARLNRGESVVEIGPGEGFLTQRLLDSGAQVTAIELDQRLYERIGEKFAQTPGLKLVHANFLKFDLNELPFPSVFVANLPYAVAAPILQRILAWPGWKKAVLMFQKEVGERLLAAPGSRKYGLLTVSAVMKSQIEAVCAAPRRFFRPPPQVDSMVVRLTPRAEPLLPSTMPERTYLDVVRAAFSHRRKTVLNSLAMGADIPKDKVALALRAAGLEPECRAEDISPESFVALTEALSGLK